MKTKNLLPVLLIGFSSSVFAAKSIPSPDSLSSAMEVLNLPGENRRMAIDGNSKFYDSFISLAFNEKQPMNVRWKALMGAAESKKLEATADLLKAGKANEWFMRNAALVALSEVNPIQAQKLAQTLIKDKALVVRSAAVEILGKEMSEETRELMWEELNKDYNFKNKQSLWIRYQIVEQLAKKPMDRETKTFAGLLTDADARVQLPAVRGLQKLTGVKLGETKLLQSELVALWKDYVKKEKL
ncbi:HEAT repeat domain-containing protein [Bdellovibrio sp. HCB209]|uniref:HEAT repeat domain-containing protein n=1 Tax=Bdellovibrio sp. HCB209 TaxID=3394354 RepID=UPI0039B419C1